MSRAPSLLLGGLLDEPPQDVPDADHPDEELALAHGQVPDPFRRHELGRPDDVVAGRRPSTGARHDVLDRDLAEERALAGARVSTSRSVKIPTRRGPSQTATEPMSSSSIRAIASCTDAFGLTVTTRTVIASPTAMPERA